MTLGATGEGKGGGEGGGGQNNQYLKLHLFDISPLCNFKCVLKLSVKKDEKSHWLQLFLFIFHWDASF